MKRYKFLIPAIALILALTGCEKTFEELEVDPNRATSATPSLVFQGVLQDMYGATGSPWGAEMRWNQFYASNYNYYATNEYSWTSTGLNFFTLKNVQKMEEEARKQTGTDANPYAALGKFFRAYFLENMTRRVGDIPMNEALKGLSNQTPKYDNQKAVYLRILSLLDESNTDLAALITKGDRVLAGDIYLGNDLRKWQKVVNTYKLRVLISLSRKDTDTDLNVKTRFAEVLGNPSKFPIMESMGDNLQYVHNTINKYPRNPSNFGFNATRENLAKTYVDLLVEREDPRIFVVAEPAEAKLKAGLQATDFKAYTGASSGEDLADMSTKALAGEYSFQSRRRYYSNDVGEPVFIIGYPELMFTIAEGINRGWAAGDAETYYQKGITASMNFYDIKDAAAITTYLNGPKVLYAGNTAAGLQQILTQKYIAFFQNSGMEAWYNQRRTGIPAFLTGVGTGNSGQIPKRWLYPNTERVNNPDNYKAAVQTQFGGSDTVSELIWMLK